MKKAFEISRNKSYNICVGKRKNGRNAVVFQVNDVILYGTQGVFQIADWQRGRIDAIHILPHRKILTDIKNRSRGSGFLYERE
jgi:hypothetical protein